LSVFKAHNSIVTPILVKNNWFGYDWLNTLWAGFAPRLEGGGILSK